MYGDTPAIDEYLGVKIMKNTRFVWTTESNSLPDSGIANVHIKFWLWLNWSYAQETILSTDRQMEGQGESSICTPTPPNLIVWDLEV